MAVPPSPDWRLRTFRPGDEPGIAALFERGFGRPIDEAVWRWKYRRGTADNVWLAVDADERPIFHYAGIPRRWQGAGEDRGVMVTSDAVTDPAWRRRGLFSAAMEAAHGAWAESGHAAVLGLPNEQWGSRVRAFDWRPLFPLRWQIRPLRPEALLARRLGWPALRRLTVLGGLSRRLWRRRVDPAVTVREVGEASDGMVEAWESCRRDGKVGLARDREWLDGRYFSCPHLRYRALVALRESRTAASRIVGYLIYRFDREHRYGFVAEIVTRPADAAARRALVSAAVERLAGRGAVAVAALAVPGSEVHRDLRRSGFLWSWGEFTVRCVPLADDLPWEVLRDPRRWWLCGGDFDVI